MIETDPKLGRITLHLKRLFFRLFRRGDRKEDFIEQIHEAEEHSVLNADAVSMMEGVLQISDLAVRDVMVPRARMDFINLDENVNNILDFVTKIAHSRFPVTDGNKDEVIGILLAKDLLSILHKKEQNLRGLIRPAVFVPESKKLNSMLKDFRINRNHMAIVIDEYGGVSGLITIEDVLEQIVGDIEDEHDTNEEKDNILQIPYQENRFRIRAGTSLEQFNEVFSCNFFSETVETIGGFVTDHLGHVPRRGESVEVDGIRFEIQRADARRLHLLIVERCTSSTTNSKPNDDSRLDNKP
jgi:magnesium and cobalt transporter